MVVVERWEGGWGCDAMRCDAMRRDVMRGVVVVQVLVSWWFAWDRVVWFGLVFMPVCVGTAGYMLSEGREREGADIPIPTPVPFPHYLFGLWNIGYTVVE